VAVDGGVPLVSHPYPGDKPDVTQFPDMVKELAERIAGLCDDDADEETSRFTLVFDAGQNSNDNYDLLDDLPFHFVGSLPPSDHPDLLAVPKSRYRSVDKVRLPGVRAFEARKVVFGVERRIVGGHSQGLHDKQSRSFDQTLAEARRQLAEVAGRLARGKTRKPRHKVEAEIAEILRPRWLSRVISTTLTGEEPAELRLIWRTKPKARADLEEEVFGKRILFTDKDKSLASTAQVVIEYRSQEEAEADFRQMKDPKVVSFSPRYHFTDHKIRVHVFCCVLALMAARLMVREADHAGLHLSVRKLLDTLAGIEETLLLYEGERGRPRDTHERHLLKAEPRMLVR
jgi:transposase